MNERVAPKIKDEYGMMYELEVTVGNIKKARKQQSGTVAHCSMSSVFSVKSILMMLQRIQKMEKCLKYGVWCDDD